MTHFWMKYGQFSKQNKKEIFSLKMVKQNFSPSFLYSDSIWKNLPNSAGTHKLFQSPKTAFFSE